MAELLVYAVNNFKEDWNPEYLDTISQVLWQKWRARFIRGDIIQVYENGRCTEQPSADSKFVIIKIPDLSYPVARSRCVEWVRSYTATITLDDPPVYEYELTLTDLSVSGSELFDIVKEQFGKLPPDIELLNKSSHSIEVRLTTDNPLRKIAFQQNAKNFINELLCPIRRCRYRVDVENLPAGIKQTLQNDRWITVTWAQASPYIIDKKA